MEPKKITVPNFKAQRRRHARRKSGWDPDWDPDWDEEFLIDDILPTRSGAKGIADAYFRTVFDKHHGG